MRGWEGRALGFLEPDSEPPIQKPPSGKPDPVWTAMQKIYADLRGIKSAASGH